MQEILGQFKASNATLIALCPQLPQFNRTITDELGLQFPVVQDRDNELATAFGLTLETPPKVIEAEKFLGLDLPQANGNDNWDLPMPARYVLRRDREILFASVHPDHRTRSEPEKCLPYLK